MERPISVSDRDGRGREKREEGRGGEGKEERHIIKRKVDDYAVE